VRLLSSGLFALFAFTAFRLGWAEIEAQADTFESLRRAIRIEGGENATYPGRLAEIAEEAGNPGEARTWLRRAVAASPRMAPAWIALGLAEERAGSARAAESALLEAARFDRQYLPAWTLANFYYRAGNHERFWIWARRAAEMTYDDFRPLFRLCDEFEPDERKVMDRLGGSRQMLRAYVTYLAGEARRLDAAETAAWRLISMRNPADRPVIANVVTREIAAGRPQPALALWRAAFVPLDPLLGPVLTNGALEQRPSGEGFDWKLGACPHAMVRWHEGRLRIDLNGSQPDECVLLEQPVPVVESKRYALQLEYSAETEDRTRASITGIHWELGAQRGPDLSFTAGKERTLAQDFKPQRSGVAHLRLLYRREPGTAAPAAHLEIRNLRMAVGER
jgi:tetratricopeptide (TPR) repeat protein